MWTELLPAVIYRSRGAVGNTSVTKWGQRERHMEKGVGWGGGFMFDQEQYFSCWWLSILACLSQLFITNSSILSDFGQYPDLL